MIFSGRLFVPEALWASFAAFWAFSFAASAVYLINDVIDRPLDRLNPLKRDRPIASGAAPASWALVGSTLLALLALAFAVPLPPVCLAILVVYLLTNIAYSVRLKHVVLLDVGVIAFGFVLRVLHGVYAIEAKPTSWIVLCMFFLALFLGFAKRRGEMHLMGEDEPYRRPVLAKYQIGFLDLLLCLTATITIVCYTVYTVTGRQGDATLVVTVPLVTYGVFRYMLLVMVDGEGESPDRLLLSDRLLVATSLTWALLCVIVIYSNVHLFES